MERKHKKVGSELSGDIKLPPVPLASEAEKGLASIAVNHPQYFVNSITEARFDTKDILDPLCSVVVAVVIDQTVKNASTDIRVMFERTRERYPQLEFVQLSQIWQYMPVQYALPEYMELIKNASKRRGLLSIAHQALIDIGAADISTPDLVSDVSMKLDGLSRELNPPSAMDTKKMLLTAIDRYQTGDDTSQRLKTGFDKIDNITPIRYGDFLVIGGQEKSGKSMLATNIIANLILNQTNATDQPNTAQHSPQ